jgi:hypothetical protein
MKPLWGKLRDSYFLYKSQVRAPLAVDSMGTGLLNFFRCKGMIFREAKPSLRKTRCPGSPLTLSHCLPGCLASGLLTL